MQRVTNPFGVLLGHALQQLHGGVAEKVGAAGADLQHATGAPVELQVAIGARVDVVDALAVAVQEAVGAHEAGTHLGADLGAVPAALHQEALIFPGGHGLGEVIALHVIAAQRLQRQQLLLGLHALGHHGHPQVVGDVDDQLDHSHVPPLPEGAAHEGHVQLQRVDGQLGQHAQRGIAGSEVVHLDAEAHPHAPQLPGGGQHLVGFAGVGGFGDLQHEVLGIQVAGFQDLVEYALQVRVQHVDPGYVHGHGHGEAVLVLPLADAGGGFAPDEAVQLQYHAALLQQRYEHHRADQAQLGVIPAHQRLGAGEHRLVGPDVKLGLEVDLEAPVFHGAVEVLQQPVAEQRGLVQLRVVDADGPGLAALDRIGGHPGPVEAALDVQRLVHLGIDAHAQAHPVRGAVVHGHVRGQLLHQRGIILVEGAVQQEGVGPLAAAHAAHLAGRVANALADLSQNIVGIVLAVALVEHVELVDVHHHGVHGHLGVALVVQVDVAQEVVDVVQPGQAVALRGFDGLPALGQLHATVHPGLDDLPGGVGLRYEIHGADFQAFQLRVLIGGEHDDGQLPQVLVRLDGLEDLHAVHAGHLQIQQQQRQVALVGFDQVHGLDAVLGIEHVVIGFDDVAQHHPVDRLVLDHQHLLTHVEHGGLVAGLFLLGVLVPADGAQALQQLLFFIHQRVRALEHLVEADVLALDEVGNAAGYHHALGGDVIHGAVVQHLHQFLAHGVIPVREYDHEFVAAGAVDGAVLEDLADQLRGLADVFVAGLVAEGIVDLLQAVHVADRYGEILDGAV